MIQRLSIALCGFAWDWLYVGVSGLIGVWLWWEPDIPKALAAGVALGYGIGEGR